ELQSKKNSLERMLRPLNPKAVEVHAAPRRWSYRNRMQLHYDLHLGKLGLRTPNGIVEIPNCLMPNEQLATRFIELQLNWKELVKGHGPQGHIEIYAKESGVQTTVNEQYADGG